MKKKKIIILLFVLVLLSGCISIKSNKTDVEPIPEDGGFYVLGKNQDGDYMWSQKTYLATTSSSKPHFRSADVLSMFKDPQDKEAIYIGTKKNGLYYTYDSGDNWFQADKFKNKQINSVAISYNNKCVIYVASGPELYRSDDCNRTWVRVWSDTRQNYYISALAVDSYNEGTIYMGLSFDSSQKNANKEDSEVNKSIDFGVSWQPNYQFRAPKGSLISKILINPKDTRIVYVATNNAGLFRTGNGGEIWSDITGEKQEIPKNKNAEFSQSFDKLIDFTSDIRSNKTRDSLIFRDMVMIPGKADSLIHASNYGLLRSDNGGDKWSEIKLIPPEGEDKAIIYSLAINSEDGNEFYYGTDSTLFRTIDGGVSWTTIKGPGTRAIYEILVVDQDKKESNIYVGVYNLKPPAKK